MSQLMIAHSNALLLLNSIVHMTNPEAVERYIQQYDDGTLYDNVRMKLVSFIKRELADDGTTLSRIDRPAVSKAEVNDWTIVQLVRAARGNKPIVVGCAKVSVLKAVEEMLELIAAENPAEVCLELADVLVVLLTRSFGG